MDLNFETLLNAFFDFWLLSFYQSLEFVYAC